MVADQPPAEVLQCDTDAAVEFWTAWHTGREDADLPAAFAKHRLASQPPAPVLDEASRAVAQCIAIVREVRDGFLSEEYATGQPVSSFTERFACDQAASAIENHFAIGTTEQHKLLAAVQKDAG